MRDGRGIYPVACVINNHMTSMLVAISRILIRHCYTELFESRYRPKIDGDAGKLFYSRMQSPAFIRQCVKNLITYAIE